MNWLVPRWYSVWLLACCCFFGHRKKQIRYHMQRIPTSDWTLKPTLTFQLKHSTSTRNTYVAQFEISWENLDVARVIYERDAKNSKVRRCWSPTTLTSGGHWRVSF